MPKYQLPHDSDGVPMQVFGLIPHDGVDTTTFHNLGTVAAGAVGVFPTNGSFLENAAYEFCFFDNADQEDGIPPNVVYAVGGSALADAPLVSEHRHPASSVAILRLRFFAGQTKIAFRNPAGGGGKTVLITAKRIG